ncbi:MAG: SRPBCC domain-containing protein [Microbacteriaceae bacterium]|nr:SRPBCC domain-containing protein [Microbacteriaceae bacterium]
MKTTITSDADALTLTLAAGFPVAPHRLWDAFADVRQLERFWGTPTRPTTFTRHDFADGGHSAFWETAPDGELVHGRWEWASVEPIAAFAILDEDAEEFGELSRDIPATRITGTIAAAPGDSSQDGSQLALAFHFRSRAGFDAAVAGGTARRIEQIADQLADVLDDPDSFALPPTVTVLSEQLIRISGFLAVSVEDAWRAHQDLEVLGMWMSGPEGWTMPVVEGASRPGERYRMEWENPLTGERIGHEGEVLEAMPPHRIVLTERAIGTTGDGFINSATYTAVDGGTVLSRIMHCPTLAARDELLASGFARGVAESYAHLEAAIRSL